MPYSLPLRRPRLALTFALAASLGASVASAQPARQQPPPGTLRSFDVKASGALGDGQTIDTAAIQKTIDACHAAGGGRVLFPPGRYLSGTIRLKSGIDLHLAKDARLIGIEDLEAYGGFVEQATDPAGFGRPNRWRRGLIVGENLTGISFTGTGTIDGNKVFDPQGEEKMRGPHTILLGRCQNVTLRDITLRDSANYAFLFYTCSTVRVENALFEGGWDGVHFRGAPDAWNRDVRITGCRFFTGDDSVAGAYIEDATVENCTINTSCNGVRLIGPARRLSFQRCEFFGPGKFEHRTSREQHRTNMLAALCIQPSAWDDQPGPLEDLRISDITIRNVACAFHIAIRQGNTGNRLSIERMKATGLYLSAASIESWAEEPLRQIELKDIQLQYSESVSAQAPQPTDIRKPGAFGARKLPSWGLYGRHLESLSLQRVSFSTVPDQAGPVIRLDNVTSASLKDLQYPRAASGIPPIDLHDVEKIQNDESQNPQPPNPPKLDTQPISE